MLPVLSSGAPRGATRLGAPEARLGASVSEPVRSVNGPPWRTCRSWPCAPAGKHGRLRYRPAMQVRRFDDPGAFREAATPYLLRDEARHNLLLGISTTLIQRPDLYEAFDLWVVSEGDDVTAVALRTHPLNLVLAQPSSDAALDVLVDRLLQERQALPGVIAALPELEAFVGAWTSANDLDATRIFRHGVYELRDVLPVPAAPGRPRPVTPEDRDLVIAMDRRLRGRGAAGGQRGGAADPIRGVATRGDGRRGRVALGGRRPAGVDVELRRSDTERHAHRTRVHPAGAARARVRDDARVGAESLVARGPVGRSASCTPTSTTRPRTRCTGASATG